MRLSEVFKSDFLKAEELEEDTVVTITGVEVKELGSGKDKDTKPVLSFAEMEKGLACNRTNAQTIAKLYGDDTDDWIGKPITLFATEVDFRGEQVLAIRVRSRAPKATGAKPQASAPTSGPAGGSPVSTERARAWKAFAVATPSLDTDTRKEQWTEAVKHVFPARAERDLTADQWKEFALEVQTNYAEDQGGFLPPI